MNEPALRALVLRPEFASKFFLKGIAGKAKTLELRSHNLQCVKPGGRFFIAACKQGKNQHGVNVLKILGSVEFVRNEHIKNEDVPKRYPEHLCPHDAYQKLSSKWQKDHCIGWVVRDAQMFGQPKWLQTVHQERCGLGGGVFMLGTCSWFMFVYLHPLTHVFFRFCDFVCNFHFPWILDTKHLHHGASIFFHRRGGFISTSKIFMQTKMIMVMDRMQR